MIRSMVKSIWTLMVLGVVGYGFFFVELGERTLFQHVSRIWATDEAQDLRHEVGVAGARLGDDLERQVQELRRRDAGTRLKN